MIFKPNVNEQQQKRNNKSQLLWHLWSSVFWWHVNFPNLVFFRWRRKWQPTPVFLPRESYGWRSLVGCCPQRSYRVGHDCSHLACMHALEKEMATHSSILAWRIPGTEEPGGLLSMGSHRVGHDWSDLEAAASVSFRKPQLRSMTLLKHPSLFFFLLFFLICYLPWSQSH